MEATPPNKHIPTSIVILIVTILLISGTVVLSQQNKSSGTAKINTTSKQQAPSSNNKQVPTNPSRSNFKQGTYSATGKYFSPGGDQQIKVSVTLESDGIIADTSAQGDNKSSNSQFYQSSFIANYKNQVVGKKITEVKLDHVGASSLTSGGFNNALDSIKKQANA